MRSNKEFKELVMQKCEELKRKKVKRRRKITVSLSLVVCMCSISGFTILNYYDKPELYTGENINENENYLYSQNTDEDSKLYRGELNESEIYSVPEIEYITVIIKKESLKIKNKAWHKAYTDIVLNSEKSDITGIPEEAEVSDEDFTVTVLYKDDTQHAYEWYGPYCHILQTGEWIKISPQDKEELVKLINNIPS